MNQYFPEEFIERVREAVDIVSVVSEYITLKRVGANFQARCPFHMEKTPSFSVSPRHQVFKCFGCNKAGNVFNFLMAISGLSFPEAVAKLAQQHGIPIPENERQAVNKELRLNMLELMQWSTRFFQRQLHSKEGRTACTYLQQRGVSTKIIEQFQLGFAVNEYERLLQAAVKEGFSYELLEAAGLVAQKQQRDTYYDRFRNRLIFPICNSEGKVIAFGGRVLAAEIKPKYLNSPETSVFSKKRTLYALHHAKQSILEKKRLIITEGYTDAIMAHQYNFNETIATLGTALTEQHTRMIRRYAQSVILVFDGDSSGQNAMLRSLPYFLQQGLSLKVAVLPESMDPCDVLLQQGQQAFATMIDQAKDVLDFQIPLLAGKYDLHSTSGKRFAIVDLKKTIKHIPDKITQQLWVTKIAKHFQIPSEMLMSELVKPKKSLPVVNGEQTEREYDEEFVLWVYLHYPQQRQKIAGNYGSESFKIQKLQQLAVHVFQFYQDQATCDISALSASIEPELGEKLVNIYYNNYGELENEQLAKRLQSIYKALKRQQQRERIQRFKEMLATSNDQELSGQILQDTHNICKQRMKGVI